MTVSVDLSVLRPFWQIQDSKMAYKVLHIGALIYVKSIRRKNLDFRRLSF